MVLFLYAKKLNFETVAKYTICHTITGLTVLLVMVNLVRSDLLLICYPMAMAMAISSEKPT